MGQKKYELTLLVKNKPGEFELASADKIEGDTLLEVLAQLPLVVARIQELQIQKWKRVASWNDEDIPF